MFARIFISTVSREFLAYREKLRRDFTAPNVEVKVQEDFKGQGKSTLALLNDYITLCDAVVHLVGNMTGAAPPKHDVDALLVYYPHLVDELPPLGEALRRGAVVSYTQWEAWLALYHRRALFIAKADENAVREETYADSESERAAQAEHLKRLAARERFPDILFTNPDQLASRAWAWLHDKLPQPEPKPTHRRPNNLPYASLGSLFKGRDEVLGDLHKALTAGTDAGAAISVRALHGLGGIGKTRLAVEYALKYAENYSALLFLRADTPALLFTSLAALAGPDILDLPDKDAREDAVKISAALGWLEHHPGWLIVLDNVDAPEAVAAVGKLLAKLRGGKILITGRAGGFPGSVRKIELGVLDIPASVEFLLERTEDDRIHAADDAGLAEDLASELGGLALGLEQAGAYIAAERTSFKLYLKLWQEKRATVLDWFDKNLMSYDHDTGLAATWATSVARLTANGRRLLERLAFLAPESVPDSLLDVAVDTDPADFDAKTGRGNLFAYSLIARAQVETGKASEDGFAVHRLVQDFTRRDMTEERRGAALREALEWVDAAFVGNPADVRTWPLLDPLASHASAVAERADRRGIVAPTARLYGELGQLFDAKARHSEAERMSRRALAIDEASYGPDHPNVAIRLNNLGGLLTATNRLEEAEPMMRRALAIDEASYGPDHPTVAIRLNNLAQLLQATNRLDEAEPMMRRALAMDEASYGSDHPNVAIRLNNLAALLKDTNRLDEATPMMRRVLAIGEASYGPDHPIVAISLNNFAQLLRATNRLDEANPMMRRALAIDEASYGPDHPIVALRLSNLALLLVDTNRLDEAQPMMRRALALFEASYGPDHPSTITVRNNLNVLLERRN